MSQAVAQLSMRLPARERVRLAFLFLNAAAGWRRLTKHKRTPGIWTAHIPDHPERHARHALACSRACGRPQLP